MSDSPLPSRAETGAPGQGAAPTERLAKPLKNPPRRGRRSRPVNPPADGTLGQEKATPTQKAPAEKRRSRSMVCPACGKFFDITARTPGSHFDCYCGRQLRVPDEPPRPALRGTHVRLRLIELRQRNRMSLVSLLVGFAACIALLSACLFLVVQEQRWFTGTCAGLAGVAFLAVAVVATREYRRTKAEIAGEMAEGDEG